MARAAELYKNKRKRVIADNYADMPAAQSKIDAEDMNERLGKRIQEVKKLSARSEAYKLLERALRLDQDIYDEYIE